MGNERPLFNPLNKCRHCRRLTAESWDGTRAWGLGPCSNSFGTGPEEMTALGNYGVSPYARQCETCAADSQDDTGIECRNNGLLTLLPKQKTVFSPWNSLHSPSTFCDLCLCCLLPLMFAHTPSGPGISMILFYFWLPLWTWMIARQPFQALCASTVSDQ